MSARAHPRTRRPARRVLPPRERGFTLIELMVTIIILVIGLFAMAGTTAVVTRHIGGGAQMALAASTAQARFERLRAESCLTLSDGDAESRGISETWVVSNKLRAVEVTLVVGFNTSRGWREHEYKTRIPCPELL